MAIETATKYLDRPVTFVEAGAPGELPRAHNSTVLLWLHTRISDAMVRSRLIEAIVNANPLAILIGGLDAEALFDDLLRALDMERVPRPVLTKFTTGEVKGCVEEFLQATWPYDSRFDEWSSYLVVSYGGGGDPLRKAVEGVVHQG